MELNKLCQRIKTFSDGSYLEYDRGRFDDWCVYLTDTSGNRRPPRDTDYFSQLKTLASILGRHRLYGDYVRVYEMTGTQVNQDTLDSISHISEEYGENTTQVDKIFSILYLAMIAEEKKANTRLGKRIKRLGIYELLIENRPVHEAANFMRGMGWRDIARLCNERGF